MAKKRTKKKKTDTLALTVKKAVSDAMHPPAAKPRLRLYEYVVLHHCPTVGTEIAAGPATVLSLDSKAAEMDVMFELAKAVGEKFEKSSLEVLVRPFAVTSF